jgi:hypothetical protein
MTAVALEQISPSDIRSTLSNEWLGVGETEALALHNHALDLARGLLLSDTPVVVRIIDNTRPAGLHVVPALLDPGLDVMPLMLPAELDSPIAHRPYRLAAHLPTACHLLEVASAICTYCGTFPRFPLGLSERAFLEIVEKRLFPDGSGLMDVINIPLMFDPPLTNALIFHTHCPSFSPLAFLEEWHRVLAHNNVVDKLVLRHTMFLWPPKEQSELEKPTTKTTAHFRLLPTQDVRDRFRLLHLARISRWDYETALDRTRRIAIDDLTLVPESNHL